MTLRGAAKDVHRLLKTVSNFSAGQARVSDWDSDNANTLMVEITPSDGYYKGGTFVFKIELGDDYPICPPVVVCMTDIYHPNIELRDEDNEEGTNVCLNLLECDIWTESMTLEDCVMGLLFLFYHPNLEDPLSPMFGPGMEEEEFAENVRQSLLGEEVEEHIFPRNYNLDDCKNVKNQNINEDLSSEVINLTINDQGAESVTSTTIPNDLTPDQKGVRTSGEVDTDLTMGSGQGVEDASNDNTEVDTCDKDACLSEWCQRFTDDLESICYENLRDDSDLHAQIPDMCNAVMETNDKSLDTITQRPENKISQFHNLVIWSALALDIDSKLL